MNPLEPQSALSRRGFVKAAGLAVSAGAALAAASRAQARTIGPAEVPRSQNAKPHTGTLRIGLIGCGGRGTGAAVQALKADPDTRLVAMGDVFPDRLESSLKGITASLVEAEGDAAASRVDVPPERRFTGFDSHAKVIASEVDVVLLVGYPHFRPAHLAAAIDAGKHVFAEKPVAVDAPGVRSVIESAAKADQKGLALLIGFCWRYHDGMRAAFEQIHRGLLGDIISIHTTYHTDTLSKRARKPEWSDLEFQMRNWWHFNWISGDHIVEQAVHSIDRLSWALGDKLPAKIECLGGRAARSGPEHGDVFDHFSAIYEYAGEEGARQRCFHSCRQIDGCSNDNSDYVYGTRGSAYINPWVGKYTFRDPAGKSLWTYNPDPAKPKTDMYQNEHDALFKSIREGRPINDGQRGANSTMLAIVARMAAYTGQTLTWEQALNSTERLGPERYELGPAQTPSVPIPGKTKFT